MRYSSEGASHLPVLIKVLNLTSGPVLEMGMGPFSTPLMHWLCLDKNLPLTSFENDKKYFDESQKFATPLHQIKLVQNWDEADIEKNHWGAALIDHKPGERRKVDIKRIAQKADYIIVHDSEEESDSEYGFNDPKEGIYPLFKYRFNYKKAKPYTTVLSNFKNLKSLEPSSTNELMLGKWDGWYKNLKEEGPFRFGDTLTYHLAENFLRGLEVEDWGCGACGFKLVHEGKYIGLDGSKTPFADKTTDLRDYRSSVEGIMMRHVLEHNYDWEKILENAISSFRKRFCLVIFTPFSDETRVIAQNKKYGVDVPDISFKKEDIQKHFRGLKWGLAEGIKTKTQYGKEHVYYVEK